MTDLRYSYMEAHDCKEDRHAQEVMRELGIIYQYAVPQSLGDQWHFWNCKNAPSPLPAFLTEIGVDPHEMIGYGLSKEMADSIVAAREKP